MTRPPPQIPPTSMIECGRPAATRIPVLIVSYPNPLSGARLLNTRSGSTAGVAVVADSLGRPARQYAYADHVVRSKFVECHWLSGACEKPSLSPTGPQVCRYFNVLARAAFVF